MKHLTIDIRGAGGSGKTTVAHKIRDMLSLDELFKDRPVFIFYEEETSEGAIESIKEAHPDAVLIYDGYLGQIPE